MSGSISLRSDLFRKLCMKHFHTAQFLKANVTSLYYFIIVIFAFGLHVSVCLGRYCVKLSLCNYGLFPSTIYIIHISKCCRAEHVQRLVRDHAMTMHSHVIHIGVPVYERQRDRRVCVCVCVCGRRSRDALRVVRDIIARWQQSRRRRSSNRRYMDTSCGRVKR